MQPVRALLRIQSRAAIRHSIKLSIRPLCSSHACQNRAPKAPSIRRQSRAPSIGARPKLSQREEWRLALNEHLKPTLALFETAKRDAIVGIDPEDVVQILRSYCDVAVEPGWEVRFCRENNIKPSFLTIIGLILSKSSVQQLRRMGENMFVCSAKLGDIDSIIIVLTRALQTGELHHPELLVPMTKLQFHADRGNLDAMVLYGRILEHQKKHAEAAWFFQRVAETPRGASTDHAIGASLVKQGDISFRDGKRDDAMARFKKAALEFDIPEAYYKFALLLPDEDSLKHTYMLKAASSGISEAVAEVARLYSRSADLQAIPQKSREDRIHAKQWLELASFQERGKSGVAVGKP